MRAFLLLFTIVFSGSLSAQEYYKLFYKFLPGNHLSYFSAEAIDQQLKADASLEPRLIYFRLEYYNRLMNNKDSSSESNGLNYCRSLTRKYLIERNAWLEKQAEVLNKNFTSHDSKKLREQLLNSVVAIKNKESKYNEALSPSINTDNFYRYIILKKQQDTPYNPGTDYGGMLQKERELVVSGIISKVNTDNPDSLIEPSGMTVILLDNWFLLRDTETSKLMDIYHVYSEKMQNKVRQNRFILSAGYSRNYENNTGIVYIPVTMYPREFGRIKTVNDYSLQAEYRYYIRQINSYFSYISTFLTLSAGDMKFDKNLKLISHVYQNSPDDYLYEYFYINSYKPGKTKHYSISLSFTTPVLLVSNNIAIEAGFRTSMEYMKSSFDIIYIHSLVHHVNGIPIVIDDKKFAGYSHSQTIQKFNISPLIAVNMDIFDSVSLKSAFTTNCMTVTAGYMF
jgi:hypothetical protein